METQDKEMSIFKYKCIGGDGDVGQGNEWWDGDVGKRNEEMDMHIEEVKILCYFFLLYFY
jgi:hypothetical protein